MVKYLIQLFLLIDKNTNGTSSANQTEKIERTREEILKALSQVGKKETRLLSKYKNKRDWSESDNRNFLKWLKSGGNKMVKLKNAINKFI